MWVQTPAALLTVCDLRSCLTVSQPWASVSLSIKVGWWYPPNGIVAKCERRSHVRRCGVTWHSRHSYLRPTALGAHGGSPWGTRFEAVHPSAATGCVCWAHSTVLTIVGEAGRAKHGQKHERGRAQRSCPHAHLELTT